MVKEIDSEDQQFEQMLADKQHRELIGSIKQLISSIKNDNESDRAIVELISQQKIALSSFIDKLNSISQPTAPQVTVNSNNDAVVKSVIEGLSKIEECCDKTNELLQQLIDVRMADVKLTPKRNNWSGLIEEVTAQTILNKPSKYKA